MSDQDVVIRIVGDANDLVTKLDDVKQKMQNIGTAGTSGNDLLKKNYKDISVELSELNEKLRNEIALKKQNATQTAKRITDLQKEKKAIDDQANAMTHQKSIGENLTGIFQKLGITIGIAFATRAVIDFAKESVKAALVAEKSMQQLSFAVRQVGGGSNSDLQKLMQQAKDLMGIFSHEEIESAAKRMIDFGLSAKQVYDIMPNLVDAAAQSGKTLEELAAAVDKGAESGVLARSALGQLGIVVKDTGDREKNFIEIQKQLTKFTGGNTDAMKTQSGALSVINKKWEEFQENIGDNLLHAMGPFRDAWSDLVGDLEEFTRIPLSEKMTEQKQRVNDLVTALTTQNLAESTRLTLWDELIKLAPEVTAGIDSQNISTGKLKDNLAAYNKEMIVAIALESNKEKITKAAKDLAADQLRLAEQNIQVGNAAKEQIKVINSESDIYTKRLAQLTHEYDMGRKSAYQYALEVDAIREAANAATISTENAYLGLSTEIINLEGTQKIATNSQKTFNNVLNETTAIENELKKSSSDIIEKLKEKNKFTEEGNKLDGLNAKGLKDQEQALKDKQKALEDEHAKELKFFKDLAVLTQLRKPESKELSEQADTYMKYYKLLAEAIRNKIALNPKDFGIELPITLEKGATPFTDIMQDANKDLEKAGEKAGLSFIDGLIDKILNLKGDTAKIGKAKDALSSIFNDVLGMVSENMKNESDALIAGIEAQIKKIDDLIAKKQEQVDAEKSLAEQGKANNLKLRQDELNQLISLSEKEQQAKEAAIAKAKEQERTMATIKAATAFVVALSEAVIEGGPLGLIEGLAAGITLLAYIATAYSKASGAVNYGKGTAEILGGRSHPEGGTSLGAYGTAERGEFLGILKKDKTQKYGQAMLSLFDGLNNANENKKLLGLSGLMDLREINTTSTQKFELKEIPEIKGIYKEMKKQGKTVYYENGKRIEKQGANTRIVYVN